MRRQSMRPGRELVRRLVLALAVMGGQPLVAAVGGGATLALEEVTVLDPVHGVQGPWTVAIAGDRVVAAGPAASVALPEGARRVDGEGLFLLPGLWDLHTHLATMDDAVPPLLVSQGVTGVRDLGAKPEEIETLRRRVASGELLGPRIVRAGPTLNGAQNGPHHRVVDSAEAARLAVAELAEGGVDLLKVHNATGREAYFAVLAAAKTHGLEVAGHVPIAVAPLEACEAGQASIEHIATIFEGTYLASYGSELAAFQAMRDWLAGDGQKLVRCFADQQTLFVPTLRAYELRALRAEVWDRPDPRRRYLSAGEREEWRTAAEPRAVDRLPMVIELRMDLVEVGQELARQLDEAGAPVGAGTDLASGGLLPGFDLHAEIRLLAAGGLTPRAALRAATRGPGAGAGGDPLDGQIVAGAPADLVLLRQNAFDDLAALDGIEAVVLRGRLLDRAELDVLLAELEATAP